LKPKPLKTTLPDLVVLSVLSEQPMHGYQLVAELENRDVKDWAEISRPQTYYSLKKLFQMKCLAEVESALDSSLGPERIKYSVTKKGQKALNDGLSSENWASQRPPPPFLTWMALASHLAKPTVGKLIQARKKFLIHQLDRERKTLSEFDGKSDAMQSAGFLVVSLTIQMFEVELNWLEEVRKKLA
jgi:DNA-binding PadR family transcriptional regulator